MAKFKIIVSDPQTSKVSVVELEGAKAQPLVGRELGEVIDGSVVGISSAKVQITGGSDKDGSPMRPGVHGGAKKYVILSSGSGFKSTSDGERRRKMVRGEMITDETYQLNMKITGSREESTVKPPKEEKAPTRTRKKKKDE